MKQNSAVEAAYRLQDEISKLAMEACARGHPEDVHALVAQTRSIGSMIRAWEIRGIVPR